MPKRDDYPSIAHVEAVLAALPGPDETGLAMASARNEVLTKPPGALGRLEELALWYCGWRGDGRAEVTAPQVAIFAGNHGVAAQGVSAFPPEVTVQMVANFEAGGAAINQLCKTVGASLDVVPLELDRPTEDFTTAPAMDEAAFLAAFNAGRRAVRDETDLLVVGEMGIGNTTAAAAIYTALWGGDWVGRGTGVDDDGLAIKRRVVEAGVARLGEATPLEVLASLGGREIAAMAGAILTAREARVPVILDGFIACSAAAVLDAAAMDALEHCVAGHVSDEAAHARVLGQLGKAPLLDLGLRLGEGSGAALAIGVVKAALACHSGMATFAEAGVSDG